MLKTTKNPASRRAKPGKKSALNAKMSSGDITASMPVSQILALLPEAERLLAEYGLHCFHCSGSAFETLEEGCQSHGFPDDEIEELVEDLNTLLQERPERPETLTLTLEAARALKELAAAEGKSGEGLTVTLDERGSFCMEFQASPTENDRTFQNAEEPSVRLFASALTLKRIGGATIDYRDGRFKLDLQEEMRKCGCRETGCSCSSKHT